MRELFSKRLFGVKKESRLVAYFPFLSDTLDYSGNALNGTAFNSPEYVDSGIELIYPRYVEIADSDILTLTEGFLIEFDIYIYSINEYNFIINKRNTAGIGGREFQISLWNGKINFVVFDDVLAGAIGLVSDSGLLSGSWTNIAVYYDGSSLHSGMNIYINGISCEASNVSIGSFVKIRNTTAPLRCGLDGWGGSFPLNGILRNLKIYNKVV